MKNGLRIGIVAMVVLVAAAGSAVADSANVYVATVHGSRAFTVNGGGVALRFHPQPDTEYVWNENNGSAPGTQATYTSGGATFNRDGMKTFAATDIAYGKPLSSIKMEFEYRTNDPLSDDASTVSPGMNFFITDGAGNYGIWSATSGSPAYTDTSTGSFFAKRTIDLTSLDGSTSYGKVFEYNGGVSGDYPSWDEIKNWTIAGFYDYQRTPEGGFEAWNDFLWGDMTNVGTADTTLNKFGIVLFHGDTVGGFYSDDPAHDGVTGSSAERPWGQTGRIVRNYQLTIDEDGTATTYDMNFTAAPDAVVPEPLTMLAVGSAVVGLGGYIRRRRRA